MTWRMYRWVWQVVSPLYIGMPPAGALNRTRLYIPARNLWGALTAELARQGSTGFPDYQKVGKELQEATRFSYLFPAEVVRNQWLAWLPHFEREKGLVWRREDGKEEENRRFRLRLLITRPGAAIDPVTDTAAEGTLREFELISPWWRSLDEGDVPKPVGMVGYLFCLDDALCDQIRSIREILIGGDTRYGLGNLQQIYWENADNLFGSPVVLNGDSPKVDTDRMLGHTPDPTQNHCCHRRPKVDTFQGSQECISGWEMVAGKMKEAQLTWEPGCCADKKHDFAIREDGLWEAKSTTPR
ncbi:MAG: RAMP superfamily CRISPR-associated protein [Chloroflexota bacterium]|nr:MAG: hypothetical protein KatS3mg045_1395 [Bellilinea sp.]